MYPQARELYSKDVKDLGTEAMATPQEQRLYGQPPGTRGQSNKSTTYTVWENKGKKQGKKVSMSEPLCKGTLLQGCRRSWYRGYGTTQE